MPFRLLLPSVLLEGDLLLMFVPLALAMEDREDVDRFVEEVETGERAE